MSDSHPLSVMSHLGEKDVLKNSGEIMRMYALVCGCVCEDGRHAGAAHQLSSRSLLGRSQTQAGASTPCEFLGKRKDKALTVR